MLALTFTDLKQTVVKNIKINTLDISFKFVPILNSYRFSRPSPPTGAPQLDYLLFLLLSYSSSICERLCLIMCRGLFASRVSLLTIDRTRIWVKNTMERYQILFYPIDFKNILQTWMKIELNRKCVFFLSKTPKKSKDILCMCM